ncbi:serine hydrolase [Metabacillus idriensis]|uniref:serine hydrolase n=1 Tax=Metabacillus idriensis TaxID=324768 RepID=UPI00174AFBEB|nr:serine hydrolase [Metabacillus idriensis]
MKKICVSLMIIYLFLGTATAGVSAKETKSGKLSYGNPKTEAMDPEILSDIDVAIHQAIEEGITPGAVVLVARNGKILKEQAYGHSQKYDMGNLLDQPRKMKKETIFDLASVTKVMGTTQGIMKLEYEHKLSLSDPVAKYIPEFGQNGKEHVIIADLLTHTSGLTPWYPSYLYARDSKEVLNYINKLPLEYETGTQRKYSDFSFMALGFVIEKITNQRLNQYLENEIYKPLKMKNTMFTPETKLKKKIAATSWGNPYEYKMIDDPDFGYFVEEDPDMFPHWRDYTLVGEVNDGNSFYGNGGIAGHAGLFSTAKDLAVLGQTMLNGGSYGKVEIYNKETVHTFTSEQAFGQGYGFEKAKNWYMGDQYSEKAFGHTGFTGTQIIIDPEYNLQIILLTNKQNNGQLPNGSYASTGPLSKKISNIVYSSMKQ